MAHIVITLSGPGGVLDRTVMNMNGIGAEETDDMVNHAVIAMLTGTILRPGDSLTITEKEG